MLRRTTTSIDYIVPDGWHRAVVCEEEGEDDYDPWFAFIQGLAFGVEENFADFEDGLLTFIIVGTGEEWRLVDLGEKNAGEWVPEEGWKQVELDVVNMEQFMPRMGYLFSDGVFNLDRVASGMQKFVIRGGGVAVEGEKMTQTKTRMYKEFKFCMKVGEDWLGAGDRFEDVGLTEFMIGDLGVNKEFQEEVKSGMKKIVGKM